MQHADVVVIGGGVIGLSVAYELCRRGRKPIVLERGEQAGSASLAAAGMLAPVSEAEDGAQALVNFGLESLRRYPSFVTGIEEASSMRVGFRADGTLWVALDRDDAAELLHLEETLRGKGLEAAPLSASGLRALEPRLAQQVVAGLSVPGDLQLDPRLLCSALRTAVVRLGGVVRVGHEVEQVAADARGLRAVGREGSSPFAIAADAVVVAAGAWSSRALRLPIEGLRVRPVRGQIVRLAGEPLLRHVIRTPHCYVVPRAGGETLVGATMEEQGFDIAPTAGAVHDLLRHAHALVPALYEARFVEVSVGLRPALPDHHPAIGATVVPGLFLAVGHFRSGVLHAPATAHFLAECMLGRAVPELLAFAPERLGLRAERPAA